MKEPVDFSEKHPKGNLPVISTGFRKSYRNIPLPMKDSTIHIFHHCMPLSQVRFGTIRADPSWSDAGLLPAYEWLAEQIGFFPHFVSVGNNQSALCRTGYQDNWRVSVGSDNIDGSWQKVYRKRGGFPNLVLFSFKYLEGVFMDYDSWHIAINACINGGCVSTRDMKMIFKPSRTRSRWLHAAKKSLAVDLLTQDLPLDTAAGVLVRNRATQNLMEEMGFRNVEIARFPVDSISP
jgi:hypothetical protein